MVKKTISIAPYCWMIMKWTTILYICLGVCLLTAKASESRGQVDFECKLLLEDETLSLKASLNKISKQTGVDFAYNSRNLPLNKFISWTAGMSNLRMVMDKLQKTFGLEYQIKGNSLVLLPREEDAALNRNVEYVGVRRYIDPDTQATIIEGRVLDAETKEPIEGATVGLIKAGLKTKTDKNGRFRLTVPQN